MNQFRLTMVIAGQDLRRRIRNRSALVMAFAGPLSLAVVFSLLIGGASGSTFELGVVDLDRSSVTTDLVGNLVTIGAEGDQLSVSAYATEAEVRRRLDDQDLGAALVLPEGFGDAVTAGAPTTIRVLRNQALPIAGQVGDSVARSIAAGYERVGLTVATAAGLGADPGQALVGAMAAPPALALGDIPVGGRELSVGAFYGASMAILFLFFTVGFASRSVLTERANGTLARVLATPINPGAVIAGKTLSVGLLGLAGFVTVWLATSLLFDAPWGQPLAVLALMVATVVSITGVATFVAGLARSERQADVANSITAFVLALLGGNFVGPNLPPLLRTLSILTPNGWSLRAFTELNTDAAGLGDIATTLVVLTAIGAVFGAAGILLVRRVMVP